VKPSADVERLAAQMQALRSEYRTLPILIGDLCAQRAGVPSAAEIGRAALASLFEQTPEYAAQLLPAGPDASEAEVEMAFLGWLGGMTHLQRYRVLEPFYRRVPVPLFYQDLAALVVNRFVTHILTTNVDTLLEQALNAVGLSSDHDYVVEVVGSQPHDVPRDDPPTSGGDDPPTTIVKLYGDLGQAELPMGLDEIDRVLSEHRSFVKGELEADLVVVGHEIDRDEPRAIDRWLARGGGEMWWVHPAEPAADLIAPIRQSRPVTLITGEEQGDPEAFFGQLNLHLIRLPAAQVLGYGGTSPGDDLEHEFLKSRVEKARVTKYSFEQSVSPGDDDLGYQAQIGYLDDKVASYDNQLRELAPRDPRNLLMRLVDEATSAEIDQSTVDFLNQQATIVERELGSPEPNQLLVSGAMSAATSVAEGLASALSSELSEELRSAAATYSVAAS
jgi:hypothetical protein